MFISYFHDIKINQVSHNAVDGSHNPIKFPTENQPEASRKSLQIRARAKITNCTIASLMKLNRTLLFLLLVR